MLSRRTILLKPMRPAVSGYARLQAENGRTLVQLHARGLSKGQLRLFGYLPDRIMRELGSAQVNAHGELSVEVSAPKELKAFLLLDASPAPLLIGLCSESSSGDLLDVKNAALSLCERLKKPVSTPAAPTQPKPAAPEKRAPPPPPVPVKPKPPAPFLPKEIFLPAIDPAPYTSAAPKQQPEAILPPPKPSGPPVDRLRPLKWPRGFETLKGYFESLMPEALFPLPGWRFVAAAQGMWIGFQAQDGHVRRLCYAYRDAPPGIQRRCQPMQGLDGLRYQALWMEP